MAARIHRSRRLPRFLLASALSATFIAFLIALPHLPGVRVVQVEMPPVETRPSALRPPLVWLPDLPQYKYARRLALKEGLDFRSRIDLSRTQPSREQRYRLTVTERPDTLRLQEFQSWVLHIEDAGHRPVTGAALTVSGGMPQHGHGLPSRPRVQEQPTAGDYRVDGLQFSMPGWWEVKVYVSKDRRDDFAVFNVFLE